MSYVHSVDFSTAECACRIFGLAIFVAVLSYRRLFADNVVMVSHRIVCSISYQVVVVGRPTLITVFLLFSAGCRYCSMGDFDERHMKTSNPLSDFARLSHPAATVITTVSISCDVEERA